jgi:DNA-binding transcriptional LysR family regulator
MTKDIPANGLYWTELRIFLEVAKSKSFNKAAEELGVSQPTVGRAVRRLETALNIKLLGAGARGVVLTPQVQDWRERWSRSTRKSRRSSAEFQWRRR